MAKTKRPTQASGMATAPSKIQARKPAKSPWHRVNKELDRLDRKLRSLNPF